MDFSPYPNQHGLVGPNRGADPDDDTLHASLKSVGITSTIFAGLVQFDDHYPGQWSFQVVDSAYDWQE